MRTKMLLIAVVLAGLFFSLSALAIEIEDCDSIDVQPLFPPTSVSIDKFDQTLGELKKVTITAQSCGEWSAEIDSEALIPIDYTLIARSQVIPVLPIEGATVFEIGNGPAGDVIPLLEDDEQGQFNADFNGTDYSGLLGEQECSDPDPGRVFTYTNPADLAVFIGNANEELQIPVTTSSSLQVFGSVLQQSQSSASMGFDICVVYEYEVPPKCINGTKINDCTDEGIPGWEICLKDSDGNTLVCTDTDASGDYSFCGLAPGDYQVCEEDMDGWAHVDPVDGCIDVPLDEENANGVDFHNVPLSCISGHKFNSKTSEGLSGWTINLLDGNGNQIDTTQTGTGGYYEFCGLAPGSYTVCEVLKANWKATSATCIDVELVECENSENNDFFNEPVDLICVCPFYVHNDLYRANCNEIKEVDASEGILANDQPGSIVVNPDLITIDPKYGTIEVHDDGSFVYDPTVATQPIRNGVYVRFKYVVNNGLCDARYPGTAEIQVSCK